MEDKIVETYNTVALELDLPRCRALTPARRKQIRLRVAEIGEDGLLEAINNLRESSFCQGLNERGWKANIDFVLQASSCIKLLEGVYQDRFVERRSKIDAAVDQGRSRERSQTLNDLLSISGEQVP